LYLSVPAFLFLITVELDDTQRTPKVGYMIMIQNLQNEDMSMHV